MTDQELDKVVKAFAISAGLVVAALFVVLFIAPERGAQAFATPVPAAIDFDGGEAERAGAGTEGVGENTANRNSRVKAMSKGMGGH